MNRKQRDANRRTTREAQAALAAQKRGLWPWQELVMMTLADLTDGACKALFRVNPEQDPPVLVEGEADLTTAIGRGWISGKTWLVSHSWETR